MNREIRIGFFILGAIALLAIGVVILGDVHLKSGYRFRIAFNDISGLNSDAPVRIAGVEVGKVSGIYLNHAGQAVVEIWVGSDIIVRKNARAKIVSTGVIGTKYLEITLGEEPASVIKEGEEISGETTRSIEQLGEDIVTSLDEFISSFASKKGGKESDFTALIGNIREISEKINSDLAEGDFSKIVSNLKDSTDYLKDILSERERVKKALRDFPDAVDKLKKTLDDIQSLVKEMSEGKGVVGRLVSDEKMGEDAKTTFKSISEASEEAKKVLERIGGFETYWNYNLRYNMTDELARNDIGVMIKPNPMKFYYLGARNIRDSSGGLTTDAGGEKTSAFEAQIGKRIKNVTVYGGIIGGSGGFGLIYHPLRRLDLEGRAYRFSSANPWVDVEAKYRLTSFLYLRCAGEDMLDRKTFSGGLNLYIEDDDLAYLFGLGSLAATAVTK